MKQAQRLTDDVPPRLGLVLGAGASRGVSYADAGDILSPLDADFFDLLQRTAPATSEKDELAVAHVIAEVQKLPYDYWRSMERAFYTLHLSAYMTTKLKHDADHRDEQVIKEFAQCVQVLLRKAHGKRTCKYHQHILQMLHGSQPKDCSSKSGARSATDSSAPVLQVLLGLPLRLPTRLPGFMGFGLVIRTASVYDRRPAPASGV